MPSTWDQLDVQLHPELRCAINSLNFPTMTPVQAATIPQLLHNKDVAVEAVTGSGKTLAFLIPVLQLLKKREEPWKRNHVGAIILSPTRELARQTDEVLAQLLQFITGITKLMLVGGHKTAADDITAFRKNGGNIWICTPGRLEELLTAQHGTETSMAVKHLEILVLDEADRLLDMGFETTLNTILGYLPRQRRTGLFSATQTKEVTDLMRAGLRNPVIVGVSSRSAHSTPAKLHNYYTITPDNGKLVTMIRFVSTRAPTERNVLVFVPTCACVDYWLHVLPMLLKSFEPTSASSYRVFGIHGKMRTKREVVLKKFTAAIKSSVESPTNGASNVNILLCTDVMARGIDFPKVDWVLQWDPPSNAAAFVHRVGRTARQDHGGCALLLLLDSESAYVPFIERNQRVKMTELTEELDITDKCITEIRERLWRMQREDRAVMDKAIRAFVSHVRAYSKHECNLLLRLKDLPLGAMASTYGLLELPKMPELTQYAVNFESFEGPTAPIDVSGIAYRDAQREGARKRKLEVFKETGRWPTTNNKKALADGDRRLRRRKQKTQPWSEAKQRRDERKERKKQRKASESDMPKRKRTKKGSSKLSQADMDELLADIRILRKEKRRKITDCQLNAHFGLVSPPTVSNS